MTTDTTSWWRRVLTGDNGELLVGRQAAAESYVVFPRRSDPRVVVDAASSAAIADVGKRFASTRAWPRPIAGMLSRLAPVVSIVGPAWSVSADPGALTLREFLADILDTDVRLSVAVGPARINMKPVVRCYDGLDVLAIAKLGPDRHTARLVDNEAEWLARLEQDPIDGVQTASVRHHGLFGSSAILVMSVLPAETDGGIAFDDMPTQLIRGFAERGASSSPLRTSRWFASLAERLSTIDDDVVSRALAHATDGADETVRLGAWHGDWSPWNIGRSAQGSWSVWDWERAEADVPVGLDLVHRQYHYGEGLDAGRRDLIQSGVTEADAGQTIGLYLLELAARHARSRGLEGSGGRTTASTTRRPCRRFRYIQTTTENSRMIGRKALGTSKVPDPVRSAYHWVNQNMGRIDASARALPDFLIVGAQRSGTTSLFIYLARHPQVFGPRRAKGVHYFDTGFERSLDWYRSFFPRRSTLERSADRTGVRPAVGEAVPYYMFHPAIPDRIAEVIPKCRIIMVLREPLDRAVSHHAHEVRRGFETLELSDAFEAEQTRLAKEEERLLADPFYVSREHIHHAYLGRGQYANQLERYLERFGDDRVLVLDSARLRDDPAAVLTETTDFLELDQLPDGDYPLYNKRERDPVEPELRERYGPRFEESNARLRDLVPGRLSWL